MSLVFKKMKERKQGSNKEVKMLVKTADNSKIKPGKVKSIASEMYKKFPDARMVVRGLNAGHWISFAIKDGVVNFKSEEEYLDGRGADPKVMAEKFMEHTELQVVVSTIRANKNKPRNKKA